MDGDLDGSKLVTRPLWRCHIWHELNRDGSMEFDSAVIITDRGYQEAYRSRLRTIPVSGVSPDAFNLPEPDETYILAHADGERVYLYTHERGF